MEITNIEVENPVKQETVAVESPKRYAGKYESIEELEKAYKNSSKVFNENKVLQEKLKSYKVPENYTLPEVSLSESVLTELQDLAKSAGLNQEQFNKTVVSMHEQKQQLQNQLEARKKQLGDEFKVVEDYVTKAYPSTLHTMILNTLLGDEKAMSDAIKHRDQLLNSQVPGLSNQRANLSESYDSRTELQNLGKEYQKNPTEKNKNRYINLAREVAEASK